jgi:MOSC domain-containing protein YiiM
MGVLASVNVAAPRPTPWKKNVRFTGIGKQPVTGPVAVRAPGPRRGGLGSGLLGDFIGDTKHHGGDDQAVYAFQREDLDRWQRQLGRELPDGMFGENLTTRDIDVNEARVGERWRVGSAELQVTSPRTPCATFRGWLGEPGWARIFSLEARPGTYLRVLVPGEIQAGDPIEVIERPDHDVTISLYFRAITRERRLLPDLLPAAEFLGAETLELIERREVMVLDDQSRPDPGSRSHEPLF